jgi:hypothetical protein
MDAAEIRNAAATADHWNCGMSWQESAPALPSAVIPFQQLDSGADDAAVLARRELRRQPVGGRQERGHGEQHPLALGQRGAAARSNRCLRSV